MSAYSVSIRVTAGMLNLLQIRRRFMIKKEFWEKVADIWADKEDVEIPVLVHGTEIVTEKTEDADDLDDLLKNILQ